MTYGASLTYDNGMESIVFHSSLEDQYKSDFWLDDSPNLSGVEIEANESQTAGQIGTSINAQTVKSKHLIFTGTIHCNIPNARAKLIRVVSPQTPGKLIYAFQGQRWYLDCIPTRTPEVGAGRVTQPFQFQLKAAYPYWRDANEIDENLAGLQKMFKFPFNTGGRWYLSRFSDNYYKTVANNGNVPLGIQLTIYARGEFTNPEILHMGTGEKLTINRTFVKGESAFINTEYGQRGVQITDVNGVVSNGFRYLVEGKDGDIGMQLVPGENIFRYDAANGRDLSRVTIHFPQNGVVSGV